MLIYINPQDIQNLLKFKKKKNLSITEKSSSAIDTIKKRYIGLIIDDQFVRTGKELFNYPHAKGGIKKRQEDEIARNILQTIAQKLASRD